MRNLLKRKGLTQQQAADLLGLSLSSIAKRCAGAVPVRAGELLALETLADKKEPQPDRKDGNPARAGAGESAENSIGE